LQYDATVAVYGATMTLPDVTREFFVRINWEDGPCDNGATMIAMNAN